MSEFLAATSTKGPEYIIAVIGLISFLIFLRLLRPQAFGASTGMAHGLSRRRIMTSRHAQQTTIWMFYAIGLTVFIACLWQLMRGGWTG